MADTKVSALDLATPAGADHVYLVDATDTSSKKTTVSSLLNVARTSYKNVLDADTGITGDGTTNDASAIATLLAGGGNFFFPPAVYKFTAKALVTATGNLSLLGAPGTIFRADNTGSGFGTTSFNGDLLEITTSGGPFDSLSVHGVQFECESMPGSASTVFDTSVTWPPKAAGSGSNNTANALSIQNASFRRISVSGCRFYMTDPASTFHHWSDSGGDTALHIDCEEARFVDVFGNAFYGGRGSNIYLSQVGTRSDSKYAAKVDVHDNYVEGAGYGISLKGSLIGGHVHHNTLVNCARPLNNSSGNENNAEAVLWSDNEIDGYWRAFFLGGGGDIVQGNHVFNAGHFYDVAGTETSAHSGDSNFFNQPTVFYITAASDPPDKNMIQHNMLEGVNATSGTRGRGTTWGGADPYVFVFGDADNNRAHDNLITGSDWSALASETGTSTGNIVSWSDASMIEDHSKMAWLTIKTGSGARGPVLVAHLASTFTGLTSDTAFQSVTGFNAPLVVDGEYDIEALLPFIAATDGNMKAGFSAPGTDVVTGWWVGDGSGQAMTTPYTVFDAPGTNKAVFTGNGTNRVGEIRGHAIVGSGGAGNLTLQVGQNVSNATSTNVLAGAWFKVWRVR